MTTEAESWRDWFVARMRTLEDSGDDHPRATFINEFISNCRELVNRFGDSPDEDTFIYRGGGVIPWSEDVEYYEDDVIRVVMSVDSEAMFAEKLDNNNPVFYISGEGERYRWHGEANLLMEHVHNLLN